MAIHLSKAPTGALVFAMLSLGSPKPAASLAADAFVSLAVRVDNVAAVRADDLQFAEDRAGGVFEKIGVRVRWMDGAALTSELRSSLTMVVANSDSKAGSAAVFVDALGLAHPGVRRAYVFYDRVVALNAQSPRPIPTILGDVIAHELGHLVLPTGAHSRQGIMRPALDMKQLSIVTFTKVEARSIVAALRARSTAN